MKRDPMNISGASLTPPAGLAEEILSAIRKEKQRRRTLRIRRFAAVAAAVLLLTPAVTVLLPRLAQENAPADGGPSTDLLLELTGAEGPVTPSGEKDPTSPADTGETPPPSYVGKMDTYTTADSVVALSTGPSGTEPELDPAETAPREEPLWMETLRRIVGAEAFEAWLSLYEGDPYAPEAEAAAYAYFRLDA